MTAKISQLKLPKCTNCMESPELDFEIAMALQPIININTKSIFAQEALVRGKNGEPAGEVFNKVNKENLYRFDQTCRVKAVELASKLAIDSYLSINFMPNAIYKPELCIRTTLAAAKKFGFPVERIIFEVTEAEKVIDNKHLKDIVDHYRSIGFLIAIDDFGAGYSGLNLLADVQTDIIKLDMALIRNIHNDKTRGIIVKAITQACNDLNIKIIAEGIECCDEMFFLKDLGIELFQGFYFAKPAFQQVSEISAEAFSEIAVA
jgi:EAL domain-containing protein (putative c-di-GMP-specific phosphodiesterase class I)